VDRGGAAMNGKRASKIESERVKKEGCLID
jgi:hypothetical protein